MKNITSSEDYMYVDPTVDELWNQFIDFGIATDDELSLVTALNGYSIDTLNDILYVRTGFESWEDYMEEFE